MFLFMLQLPLAKFCIFRYDTYMDATVYEKVIVQAFGPAHFYFRRSFYDGQHFHPRKYP